MDRLPWYGSARTLPPYRFVPGLYPHPIRDPNGHSHRPIRTSIHPPWLPDQWNTLEKYLHGVDLFNRFYFWEAHEAWEALWKSHPPDSDPARFIQGLINAAAALLKLHMNERASSQKLCGAVLNQLSRFGGKRWMGIEIDCFLRAIQIYAGSWQRGAVPKLGRETPSIRLDSTSA